MNGTEYQKLALVTESPVSALTPLAIRLNHGALGLASELSELSDAIDNVAPTAADTPEKARKAEINLMEDAPEVKVAASVAVAKFLVNSRVIIHLSEVSCQRSFGGG